MGAFREHTEPDRVKLYENICNEIAKSNLTLLSAIVTKPQLSASSYKSPKQAMKNIEEIAFEYLLERVLLEAVNKNKRDKILAIIDRSGVSQDQKLLNRISVLLKEGEYLKKFKNKITLFGPDFRNSKDHLMLQISDVVSYITFQIEQKKNIRTFDFAKYFDIIKPRFANSSGVIEGYGIKKWNYTYIT